MHSIKKRQRKATLTALLFIFPFFVLFTACMQNTGSAAGNIDQSAAQVRPSTQVVPVAVLLL